MGEMKFCVHCGEKLEAGSKFCGNCGSAVKGTIQQAPESTIDDERVKYKTEFNEKSAKYAEPAEPEVQSSGGTGFEEPSGMKSKRRRKKKRKDKVKKKGGCLSKILKGIGVLILLFIMLVIFLPDPEPVDVGSDLKLIGEDENTVAVNAHSGDSVPDDIDIEQPTAGNDDAPRLASLQKAYTFMVFLNGTNLESGAGYATTDLAEMASVGSSDQVNIVVETGGTASWYNDIVDPSQSQRYLVKKDGLELQSNLGLRNIGDSQTLTDFIVWSVNNYPAEKYVLDLWNHGGGPLYGYGSDDNFMLGSGDDAYGDYLSMAEIREALSDAYDQTGVRFEVLGFDACLMATVEVADMAGQYANFLVASQEEEPGHGWNYNGIFSELVSNPQMDGAQLGRVIADAYKLQAEEYGKEKLITLSVIDLSYIYDVVIALENLSVDFIINMDDISTFNAISDSRNNIESYGRNNFFSGYTELVDLYDFARQITGPQQALADELTAAMDQAVVYKVEGSKRGFTGGLSIFFPYWDKDNLRYNLETYSAINGIDTYEGFLESYSGIMEGDTRAAVFETREPQEIESDVFSVVIAEEDAMNIASIYNYLGLILDEDMTAVMTLGMDTNVNYDPYTGVVTDNFSGYWTALNGNIISLNVVEDTADYNMYNIPAYINGQRCDIVGMWTFDDSFEEGGYYEVIGAWAVSEDAGIMAQKDFFELEMGDVVEPIFEVLDSDTYEKIEISSDPFTIAEAPYLDYIELPTGETYLYGFYIIDYAQNGEFSGFEIFDYVD